MKSILASLCLLLLLSGCASSPYRDRAQQLETRILSDGSKQFIYRVGLQERPTGARLDGRNDYRASRAPSRHDYQRLQSRTAHVVAATGYCREGYLELDYRLSSSVQWIRGECREDATPQDIERFGRQGTVALDAIDR